MFTGDTSARSTRPYLSEHNNAVAVLIDAFAGEPCFGHVRLTHCERSEVASLAALLSAGSRDHCGGQVTPSQFVFA